MKLCYVGGSIMFYCGWMVWYYVIGLVVGVFVLIWMFFGWLLFNFGEYFVNCNMMCEVL